MTIKNFIESISIKDEIWKDIVGYEGLYMVSSFGRVVSLSHPYNNNGGICYTKNKIMSPRLSSGGYYQIALSRNGKMFQPHTHKLVAEAFIPNPNNYPQVDHIDCNKLNNCVDNLRWCTQSMNNLNPITQKKRKANIHITRQKLRDAKSIPVVRINLNDITDVKIYPSAKSTKDDGFEPSCVSAVSANKYSQHKGYKWMYLSDYETQVSMSKNS